MTPASAPANPRSTAYLKGEPKVLGTVQIMIGFMTFFFGIVLVFLGLSPATISGIAIWGSFIYISSGALSVAAGNNSSNTCVVKASLGMSVVSAVTSVIALILFAVDMWYGSMFRFWCNYYYYSEYRCDFFSLHMWNGIYGVLFVFSLLEFIISICTSAFACKATCYTETTPMYTQPMNMQLLNIQPMNVQPMNTQPMNTQPMNTQAMNMHVMNTLPMNVQPMKAPPMYSEHMSPPPMFNPTHYNPQIP